MGTNRFYTCIIRIIQNSSCNTTAAWINNGICCRRICQLLFFELQPSDNNLCNYCFNILRKYISALRFFPLNIKKRCTNGIINLKIMDSMGNGRINPTDSRNAYTYSFLCGNGNRSISRQCCSLLWSKFILADYYICRFFNHI